MKIKSAGPVERGAGSGIYEGAGGIIGISVEEEEGSDKNSIVITKPQRELFLILKGKQHWKLSLPSISRKRKQIQRQKQKRNLIAM